MSKVLLLATKLKFHLHCPKTLFSDESSCKPPIYKKCRSGWATLEILEMQRGCFHGHSSPDSCRGPSTEPEPTRISIFFCGAPWGIHKSSLRSESSTSNMFLGFSFDVLICMNFVLENTDPIPNQWLLPYNSGICVCFNCRITQARSDSILIKKRKRSRVWYNTK